MDNPGAFQLTTEDGTAFSITSPGTFTGAWIEDLEGMLAASLQAQFAYGAGGATATVYIQTSIDQGQTPIDIAAIQFTTANGVEMVNLSGLTPKTTPASPGQQSLTPGTCIDGILGDRLRAVVVVAGTYSANTLLNISGIAR